MALLLRTAAEAARLAVAVIRSINTACRGTSGLTVTPFAGAAAILDYLITIVTGETCALPRVKLVARVTSATSMVEPVIRVYKHHLVRVFISMTTMSTILNHHMLRILLTEINRHIEVSLHTPLITTPLHYHTIRLLLLQVPPTHTTHLLNRTQLPRRTCRRVSQAAVASTPRCTL